jgi:GT2 family glycosyltransferase
MQTKTISIIVPAYNAQNTICMCIESLLHLEYPDEKPEIIIVDNNSTDNTQNLIKKYPVIYLLEEKKGPAAARNTGIKFANGSLIAFTDSDCIVDRYWLKKLVTGLDGPNIAGCGGDVIPFKVETYLDRYNAKMFWPIKKIIEGELYGYPYIITANALFRKSVLQEVGYFDESFPLAAHEDTDLGWRISQKGYELKYIPDAKIIHHHRTHILGLYKVGFKGGYGAEILYNKHKQFTLKRPLDVYIGIKRLISCFLILIKNSYKKNIIIFNFFDILFQTAYFSGFIYSKIKRSYKNILPAIFFTKSI